MKIFIYVRVQSALREKVYMKLIAYRHPCHKDNGAHGTSVSLLEVLGGRDFFFHQQMM